MSLSKGCVHERLLEQMMQGSETHVVHHYFGRAGKVRGTVILVAGKHVEGKVAEILHGPKIKATPLDEFVAAAKDIAFGPSKTVFDGEKKVLVELPENEWDQFLRAAMHLRAQRAGSCD